MANTNHVRMIKRGVNHWNQWRKQNPRVKPDLSGVDLSEQDLKDINLINANLSRANLSLANLSGAFLAGSDLSDAFLSEANLSRVNFSRADLTKADLSFARLQGATLIEATLYQAILIEACMVQVIFPYADLRQVNLSKADLSEANGIKANLTQAKLDSAQLQQINLSRAFMSEASLKGANLKGANLSKTDLSFSNLSAALLRDANLSKSIAIEVNFRGADLRNTNLKNGQCVKANFSRVDGCEVDLSFANLTGADLSEADLQQASLKEANLRDTNLTRCRLFGTNFSAATLTGVCLEDISPNATTTLVDVVCDYAYQRNNQQERIPQTGCFEPGEVKYFFAEAQATLTLGLPKDVHWAALTYSLQWLQTQPSCQPVKIQRLEHNPDGTILLRLTTAASIDKERLQLDLWRVYEETYMMLEPEDGQPLAKPLPSIDPQQYGHHESINRLFDFLTLMMEAITPNGAVINNHDLTVPSNGTNISHRPTFQELSATNPLLQGEMADTLQQPHTL